MKRIIGMGVVVAAALGISSAAWAQEFDTEAPYTRSQGWSVLSGDTVGAGVDVLHTQVGWPGISLEYLHGMTSKFDLGVKFAFNYGFEGVVTNVAPGLKLAPEIRLKLFEKRKVNLGLKAAPGPWVYFENGSNFGLSIPIGLALGIAATDAVMINAGMDLPMWVLFDDGGGLGLPILFGGGVEYFIDRNLLFTFNLRMGPTIYTYAGGYAAFTMEALMGIGFRL